MRRRFLYIFIPLLLIGGIAVAILLSRPASPGKQYAQAFDPDIRDEITEIVYYPNDTACVITDREEIEKIWNLFATAEVNRKKEPEPVDGGMVIEIKTSHDTYYIGCCLDVWILAPDGMWYSCANTTDIIKTVRDIMLK